MPIQGGGHPDFTNLQGDANISTQNSLFTLMIALLIIQKSLLEVEAFREHPDLANLLGGTKISANTNYPKSSNDLHNAMKNM